MIVGGTVRVPGDKSLTHRALLLGGLAPGTSHVGGALTSLDAGSTARVLRQLGARVSPLRPDAVVTIAGRRRFQAPRARLDCGNSGTTTRLLLGLLAAHRFTATLTGRIPSPEADASGDGTAEPDGCALHRVERGGRVAAQHSRRPAGAAALRAAGLERSDQERTS